MFVANVLPAIGDRCCATSQNLGLKLVRDLDAPLKNVAEEALGTLNDSEVNQLSRLLEKVLEQE